MNNILIITPGIPSYKFKIGWSVILKDFVESIKDSQITIYSNYFKFGKLKNKLFSKLLQEQGRYFKKKTFSKDFIFYFYKVILIKSCLEFFFHPSYNILKGSKQVRYYYFFYYKN